MSSKFIDNLFGLERHIVQDIEGKLIDPGLSLWVEFDGEWYISLPILLSVLRKAEDKYIEVNLSAFNRKCST